MPKKRKLFSSKTKLLTFIVNIDNNKKCINVRYENQNIWLTRKELAQLYDVPIQRIMQCIKCIYDEGELQQAKNTKKFIVLLNEGNNQIYRRITHYNLKMIVAIGAKLNSNQLMEFQKWVNIIAKDYFIRGLKNTDLTKNKIHVSRMKFFKKIISKFREIAQNLKDINWKVETIRSIITGFIIFLMSTAILGGISRLSPGEFTDIRLEQYLLKEISKKIGISYSEDAIAISRELYGVQKGNIVDDIIVLCGEYATSSENNKEYLDGHYICIFERDTIGFLNDLFGTKPKYIPTFIQIADPDCGQTAPDALVCLACKSIDVDNDGVMEIYLQYQTQFADRTSKMITIIKKVNSQWTIVSSDLSGIKEEIFEITQLEVYPCIDPFVFLNPEKPDTTKTILYGLSDGGFIYSVENSFTGETDWLYCVRVKKYEEFKNTYQYAYVMERLTGTEIIREPSWNIGHVYYPQNDDREINEFIEDMWGAQLGSHTFY